MKRIAGFVSICVGVLFVAIPVVIYVRFHVFRGIASAFLMTTEICFFIE
jgi:hypothetical protein